MVIAMEMYNVIETLLSVHLPGVIIVEVGKALIIQY